MNASHLCEILLLTSLSAPSLAASNEIRGFRFQSCDASTCMKMTSGKALVSHLGFGFTTLGLTEFAVSDLRGHVTRVITGTTATYFPEIATMSLEDERSGRSYLVSLKTNRIQEFLPSPEAGQEAGVKSSRPLDDSARGSR